MTEQSFTIIKSKHSLYEQSPEKAKAEQLSSPYENLPQLHSRHAL